MKALRRTNDVVEISFIQALLTDADIPCVVLDNFTSILEGSIGILPRRIMVDEEDWDTARDILVSAGIPADG